MSSVKARTVAPVAAPLDHRTMRLAFLLRPPWFFRLELLHDELFLASEGREGRREESRVRSALHIEGFRRVRHQDRHTTEATFIGKSRTTSWEGMPLFLLLS